MKELSKVIGREAWHSQERGVARLGMARQGKAGNEAWFGGARQGAVWRGWT